jgi:hypothetical protein
MRGPRRRAKIYRTPESGRSGVHEAPGAHTRPHAFPLRVADRLSQGLRSISKRRPGPGERQREAVDDAVSALWTIRGVAVDDTLVQLWKPPRVAYRNPGDLREACPLDVEERKLQAFDLFSG